MDAMLDWSQCPAVERSPDRVSGAWVFRGTRVPVKALFENLEAGARLDEFLEWFPGVTREQAEAVLEHAGLSLFRLALRQKLDAAEEDIREGRLLSEQEVDAEIARWFAR